MNTYLQGDININGNLWLNDILINSASTTETVLSHYSVTDKLDYIVIILIVIGSIFLIDLLRKLFQGYKNYKSYK